MCVGPNLIEPHRTHATSPTKTTCPTSGSEVRELPPAGGAPPAWNAAREAHRWPYASGRELPSRWPPLVFRRRLIISCLSSYKSGETTRLSWRASDDRATGTNGDRDRGRSFCGCYRSEWMCRDGRLAHRLQRGEAAESVGKIQLRNSLCPWRE